MAKFTLSCNSYSCVKGTALASSIFVVDPRHTYFCYAAGSGVIYSMGDVLFDFSASSENTFILNPGVYTCDVDIIFFRFPWVNFIDSIKDNQVLRFASVVNVDAFYARVSNVSIGFGVNISDGNILLQDTPGSTTARGIYDNVSGAMWVDFYSALGLVGLWFRGSLNSFGGSDDFRSTGNANFYSFNADIFIENSVPPIVQECYNFESMIKFSTAEMHDLVANRLGQSSDRMMFEPYSFTWEPSGTYSTVGYAYFGQVQLEMHVNEDLAEGSAFLQGSIRRGEAVQDSFILKGYTAPNINSPASPVINNALFTELTFTVDSEEVGECQVFFVGYRVQFLK